ncbi:MAG: baseplate J/gp47 family protein [Deltaproteobacteria bacterium]
MLTRHVDAHANEAFLHTATQWESVRRLVEMIDYHPSPATSALTPLVLLAKAGKRGTVEAGFEVKHVSPTGGPAVVFATLRPVEIDAELNALRPAGHDRSEAPLVESGGPKPTPTYSRLAQRGVRIIEDVGEVYGSALDALSPAPFTIRDFVDLEVLAEGEAERIGIPRTWLRQAKAKALAIVGFVWDDVWAPIEKWSLRRIAEAPTDEIVEVTTADPLAVQALRRRLREFGTFLDHSTFSRTPLADLRPETLPESGSVSMDGAEGPGLTPLAELEATIIEDISEERWKALRAGESSFRVRDFLRDGFLEDLASFSVPETWLRQAHAKASAIAEFSLGSDWHDLLDWTLLEIADASEQDLADLTDLPRSAVRALQQRVEEIGTFLDHGVFSAARLEDLVRRNSSSVIEGAVPSPWCAERKPKVEVGQLAMVYRRDVDRGEAVQISAIATDEECGRIGLTPSPVQYSWHAWPHNDSELRVAPRFKRKVWLNGRDVVRTAEPHGLTTPARVAWKTDKTWHFADVVEHDERSLRLASASRLPGHDTDLYEAQALEGPLAPAKAKAYGVVEPVEFESELLAQKLQTAVDPVAIFPAEPTVPDIGLSAVPFPGGLDFGSFLFPSPFLPVDLVKAAVELLLSMGAMVIPSTGEPVFKSIPNPSTMAAAIFDALTKLANEDGNVTLLKTEAELEAMLSPNVEDSVLFREMTSGLVEALRISGPLLTVHESAKPRAKVDTRLPRFVLMGGAEKVSSDDWIVGDFTDGPRALKVRALRQIQGGNDGPERTHIAFDGLEPSAGELLAVHGNFRGALRGEPRENEAMVPEQIELDPMPQSLRPGRSVLLVGDGRTVSSTVAGVDGNRITLEPPATGFRMSDLVIHGNVVIAGHGRRRPVKRVSSRRATLSEGLTLEVERVSTVPDSTFPRGTRSDLEVRVGDAIWTQVARLDQSGPTDPHFAVRPTEAGHLRLVFGDGRYGRRLPSGRNDVAIAHRVGAGRRGNVPPGSLTKPVHPHHLIESVKQPATAVGGEELEPVDRMREAAPATLLTLERSVSIADFGHLVAQRNDVWQARAFHRPGAAGRFDLVRVVVVPAGGEAGDLPAPMKAELERYLGTHAVPTVAVRVDGFVPQPVHLDVRVRVDPERYDADLVVDRVRSSIRTSLSLERRRIAQPLYVSEVYRVVEQVEGVADSSCAFRANADLTQITASADDRVVFVPQTEDSVQVTASRYEP